MKSKGHVRRSTQMCINWSEREMKQLRVLAERHTGGNASEYVRRAVFGKRGVKMTTERNEGGALDPRNIVIEFLPEQGELPPAGEMEYEGMER